MSDKVPKGWERVKLGEVAEIVMVQSPPSTSYNEEKKGDKKIKKISGK